MFGAWDLALICTVSIMVIAIAYVHSPEWKAFILSLPVPFTVAAMAVNKPVDATNVLGLVFLYIFMWSVRVLCYTFRCPIVIAIVFAVSLYCVAGTLVRPFIPKTDSAFWIAAAGVLLFALGAMYVQSARHEQGHRSTLPVYIKVPAIIMVVCFLVLIKQWLQGFITTFPMVALLGSYEARKSLHTMTHRIPAIIIMVLTLMTMSRLAYGVVGLGGSLLLGWIPLALEAVVLFQWTRRQSGRFTAVRDS